MELIVSSALLLIVSFLFLRAFRQSRALRILEPSAAASSETAPKVVVIVPARNEASNIDACLAGLTAQTYPQTSLTVLVVDDDSSDGTGKIVAALSERRSNLKVLRSGPLAKGWTGKSQACWIGARSAPAEAKWLCFVDADTRADERLVASAVAAAETSGADLLSLAPRQLLLSFAERLMIPCGLYLLGFSQNLSRLQAPDSKGVSATGQFMLVRRAAYEAVGGHAAVSGAICEDLELARQLKRCGFSVVLMDGARLISARMYEGWSTLWLGFAKNVLDMFGGAAASLSMAVAAVVLSWGLVLAPVADYLHCRAGASLACSALGLAAPTALAAFGFHVAGALYLGIPAWYGFLFPFGYSLGAVMILDALRRRATGRVPWKGRIYHG
jgi:chlorobactene glucosyltransferase